MSFFPKTSSLKKKRDSSKSKKTVIGKKTSVKRKLFQPIDQPESKKKPSSKELLDIAIEDLDVFLSNCFKNKIGESFTHDGAITFERQMVDEDIKYTGMSVFHDTFSDIELPKRSDMEKYISENKKFISIDDSSGILTSQPTNKENKKTIDDRDILFFDENSRTTIHQVVHHKKFTGMMNNCFLSGNELLKQYISCNRKSESEKKRSRSLLVHDYIQMKSFDNDTNNDYFHRPVSHSCDVAGNTKVRVFMNNDNGQRKIFFLPFSHLRYVNESIMKILRLTKDTKQLSPMIVRLCQHSGNETFSNVPEELNRVLNKYMIAVPPLSTVFMSPKIIYSYNITGMTSISREENKQLEGLYKVDNSVKISTNDENVIRTFFNVINDVDVEEFNHSRNLHHLKNTMKGCDLAKIKWNDDTFVSVLKENHIHLSHEEKLRNFNNYVNGIHIRNVEETRRTQYIHCKPLKDIQKDQDSSLDNTQSEDLIKEVESLIDQIQEETINILPSSIRGKKVTYW